MTTRRLAGATGLLALMAAALVPPPFSLISFGAGLVIATALFMLRPSPAGLARQAGEANEDPDLLTVFEVAEMSGLRPAQAAQALDRAEVTRADAVGWRRKLPVRMTNLRYRRADIQRWLEARV